jgi:hypothetical protein
MEDDDDRVCFAKDDNVFSVLRVSIIVKFFH